MRIPIQAYWQLLKKYLAPEKGKAFLLALTLFSGIALQLAVPQILRYFIDAATRQESLQKLIYAGIAFLAAGFLNQIFSALATWLGALVGWNTTNALRADVADHCLHLDLEFHNRFTAGEMIERIDGDVTTLSNFFSSFVLNILGSLLLGVGIILLLARESLLLAAFLAVFAVLSVYILQRCRGIAVAANIERREWVSRFFGFLEEKLGGMDDIRANAGGSYVMRRFYEINYQFFHISRKAWMLRTLLFLILMALFVFAQCVSLSMGIYFHRQGLATLGTVFLFFHYTEMLRRPIESITHQLQDLQNASAGIQRVGELLGETSRLQSAPKGTQRLGSDAPSLSFEGVTFRYGEGPAILKDLSFTLPAGRILGLLGRTGSGKTTLTRLLFNLYPIQEGRVCLDDLDVRETGVDDLRAHVGMVTQDVQLFHASIRDNLTFFDGTIEDETLWRVIRELELDAWFEGMPDGLDTMLQAGGGGLSAGEAQLLSFIRIFLKNPSLIILDEPSSKLDPATEQLMKRAFARLMKGRTGILIAHRLTTVQQATDIMILKQGQILEYGSQSDLAADSDSAYARLLRTGLEGDWQ